MKKLENIDHSVIESMGNNQLLAITDNLKVGEGLRLSNFPNYQKMRKITSHIESHLSDLYIFRRVADEKNLNYTIRRIE